MDTIDSAMYRKLSCLKIAPFGFPVVHHAGKACCVVKRTLFLYVDTDDIILDRAWEDTMLFDDRPILL